MSALLALLGMVVSAPPPLSLQTSKIGINPPKLIVLFSIDQFRADYVQRYYPYFLPAKSGGKIGGFKFLVETGAYFRNAMHNHIPTATGPGHSTLMTGSEPAYDGIVGNDWFDRAHGKGIYCVEDSSVETVGGSSGPMSPRNLEVTTVGDELKMATNGKSRVVGVAVKDRASILMAGHAADTVVWFDPGSANWVTSSWYAPTKQLPAWVGKYNAERQNDKFAGKPWEPLLPDANYSITRKSPFEKDSPNQRTFSHQMPAAGDKSLYSAILTSQFGNEITFQVAERAVEEEKLGRRDVPDVLVVNLSSNDYVGHRYGPNSPEVMDMTVRTDRLLSDFFNKLQSSVPGGLDEVAIVVTADHGVVPIPEESNGVYKTGVIRGVGGAALDAVKKALNMKYGEGLWVMGGQFYEQNLYLNLELAEKKGLKMKDVEQTAANAAASVPGIFGAYTRTQILSNGLPNYAWKDRVLNGFNATRGGDVLVLEGPGDYVSGGAGTGHGAVWDYDSHVPILLRAKGVAPGNYLKRVYTSAIAPTICQLLGIEYPSGNVGTPLIDTLSR